MTSTVADATPNVATLIDSLIATNRGDRRAFDYAGRTYSYQDVAALMNRTANMLVGLGVRPGARVLLLTPESPAFVASLLGAIKAGAVPIVGAKTESDVERCIEDAAPGAVIVHESRLPLAGAALVRIPREAIVVVGNDAHGYTGFVDAVRAQASWMASAPIAADAPALALWNGRRLDVLSHADIGRLLGGAAPSSPDDVVPEAARVPAMLRTFAAGDAVSLHAA
jgi:acyl-coenzyme A synthetase/AMP-(fatty) acid ligase